MMIRTGITGKWSLPVILIIALAGALTGCAGEESVSFSQDVKPIIDQNCLACHQEGGEGNMVRGFAQKTIS